MTNEMIGKAKECKSAEELLALAKENGIDMTAEQAKAKFAELHNEGELSDDELDSAAGGACYKYPDEGETVMLRNNLSCPSCGCTTAVYTKQAPGMGMTTFYFTCTDCQHKFSIDAGSMQAIMEKA